MMIRVLLVLLLASALPAFAQKTPKAPAPEKPKPAPVQQTGWRDLLVKLEGKTTNLGVLTKVGPDYVTVTDGAASTTYALAALLGIRTTRDEETGEDRIELLLAAFD